VIGGAAASRAALVAGLLSGLAACGGGAPEPGATIRAGHARFTVITPECVRIEYSEKDRFVDAPSIFAAARRARPGPGGGAGAALVPPPAYTVKREGRRTRIDTGRMQIDFVDDGAPPGAGNLRATIAGGSAPITWTPGARNAGNLGGALRGLGAARGPVDLGDGILSRDGWYLKDDSKSALLTDDSWVAPRPDDAGDDWYLFGYGADYAAGLRALATVAGRVPLPRRAFLGSWYSRYWPLNASDYRAVVEEYRAQGFPLDIVVFDTDWHRAGWTGWSWNRELFKNPGDLIGWLHGRGLLVTLNLHPSDGVAPHEDAYPGFMRAYGADPAAGSTLRFDDTDRRYMQALFNQVQAPLERAGVDFFWIDWQQQPNTRVAGLTHLAWLNEIYSRRAARDGQRGQILSRFAGLGDQRNVGHFSGDANALWPVLEFEVPATAAAGNAGAFFWSHDIGGHRGGRDPEMLTRWVQFGALSAALRLHASRAEDLDRRPWAHGSPWVEAMRDAYRLRAGLFPYIYSSAFIAHRDMLPLVRPAYLETPADDAAYANGQEYLFGPALLAAPITAPGAGPERVATQAVWFPAGRWRDWYTGEAFAGGTEAIVAAPIDRVPLFAREGVPFPMQAMGERMAAGLLPAMTLRCWPGVGVGRFTLYEDDGLTDTYLAGAAVTTELSCARQGDRVTIRIEPALGHFPGFPERRSWTIEAGGLRVVRAAEIDGVPAAVTRDPSVPIDRVQVSERSTRQAIVVTFDAAPLDDDALRNAARARTAARMGGSVGAAAPSAGADPIAAGAAYALRGLALHRKTEAGRTLLLVQDRDGIAPGAATLTIEERAGRRSEPILTQALVLDGAIARLPLPPFPRLGDPPAGVPLLRVARLEFTEAGRPRTIETILDRRPSALRRWRVAGPYDYAAGQPLAGQKHPPEGAPLAPASGAAAAGGDGGGWRAVTPDAEGTVDLRALWDRDAAIAYAVVVLRSPRAQPVRLAIASDDGVEAWLNGRKIHSHDLERAIDLGPDLVNGSLAAGRNVLFLKVANVAQGWGFRVEVECAEPVIEEDAGGGP
jgi:hypothetical protein